MGVRRDDEAAAKGRERRQQGRGTGVDKDGLRKLERVRRKREIMLR